MTLLSSQVKTDEGYNYRDYFAKLNSIKDTFLINLIEFEGNIDITNVQVLNKVKSPTLKGLIQITVRYKNTYTEKQVEKTIFKTGFFEYVETVPEYNLFHTPDDLHNLQWNLKKIKAEQSWSINRGGCGIVIAVIDDAIDTTHEDLRAAIWRNTNETPGSGIDDDNNGYIDDYMGWNAADNNNDPTPPSSAGNNYFDHGTHCAGIAGAITNNNVGIASVAYNAQIMPIKIGYDDGGRVRLRNVYQAIEYAIVNNANIVSMSFGGPSESRTIQDLIDYGSSVGVIFVAAAGNNGSNTTMYPAGYSNVIAVGATDQQDLKARFSSYGSWVDLSAPGVQIYSTLPFTTQYGVKSGTSMACPLVASSIALIMCVNPYLDRSTIINCLLSNTDNIDSLNTGYQGQLGSGRLNVYKAISCIKPITSNFVSDKQHICPGQLISFSQQSLPQAQSYNWVFPGGTPAVSTSPNPVIRYSDSGSFDVQLIVSDGMHFDTLFIEDYIHVSKPKAIISGNRSVVGGSATNIRVDLTGSPPFSIEYSDGDNHYTVRGIYQNPYYIIARINASTQYTLLSMSDDNCDGSVSGMATINTISSGDCRPSSSFTNISGTPSDDQGSSILALGEFIYVVGKSNNNSFGGYDGILSKYNTDGVLLWTKMYGGSNNDEFMNIITGHNGHLLLSGLTLSYGSTTSGRSNSWFVLVDTAGNIIRSGIYDGPGQNQVREAIKTSDGGYLIGGREFYSTSNCQFVVHKLDSTLQHDWGRRVTVGQYSEVFSLTEVVGVGYFIANCLRVNNVHFDPTVTKIDYQGNVGWTRHYGGPFNDGPRGIAEGLNKEVWVFNHYRISSTNIDLMFTRFDTSGNLLSASRIHTPLYEDGINTGMQVDTHGNIFLVSFSRKSNNLADIKIVHLSPNGEIIWQTGLGTRTNDTPGSIAFDGESVYYTGYNNQNIFGNNDMIVSKIGCSGVNNCLESDILYTRDTLLLNISAFNNPTITQISSVSSLNNVGIKNNNFSHTSLCSDCSSNNSSTYSDIIYDTTTIKPQQILINPHSSSLFTLSKQEDSVSQSSTILLTKSSISNGEINWSKKLRLLNFSGGAGVRSDLCNQNNYQLIATNSSSSQQSIGELTLTLLNQNGQTIISKKWGSNLGIITPSCVFADQRAYFYILSDIEDSNGIKSFMIAKIDTSCNAIWVRHINMSNHNNTTKIISDKSNNLYVLGSYNSGSNLVPFVLKMTDQGNIAWLKNIPFQGSSQFVDMVISKDSLNLALAGHSNTNSFGDLDILVALFDSSLNPIWSQYYGDDGMEKSVSIQNHNSGFAVAANTTSFDNNTSKQLLLTIDSSGGACLV